MRHTRVGLLVALTGLMSGVAAGCGDDGGFECGDGTVEMDGTCVPTDEVCGAGTTYDMATGTCVTDGLECGEGTIAMDGECVADLGCGTGTVQMGNECVPDGSVICTGNTTFDADSGTCVVDEAACADGTVFVVEAGECIPFDDSLVADITETTEPNDPLYSDTAMISPFELPAVGDTVTLGGCVEPDDFDEDGDTDADLDFFIFEISEPTTLEVRTDGVGGLAAGALVVGLEEDFPYTRGIVDNTNDGAEKTIFLPRPGQYAVAVSDSRTLIPILLDETALPAGGPDACYFVQVTSAELPASTATLTLDTPRVGPFENGPVVYEIDSAMEQLFFGNLAELDAEDEPVDFIAIEGTISVVSGDEYRGGLGVPFEVETETLTVVVESVFDLSLDPVESELEITAQGIVEYPEDGDVTLTKTADALGPFDSLEYLTFEGTAGDVAHLAYDSDDSLIPVVLSPDGALVFPCGTDFFGDLLSCDSLDDYYLLTTTGPHRMGFFNTDASVGDDYTVTASRTLITPTPLAVGTPASGALDSDDSAFFTLPASSADWLEYALTDLVDMSEGVVRFYATTEPTFGVLGFDVPQADGEVADPSFQRIYLGEADTFLIEVTDADAIDGTETFALGVSNVDFTDLSVTPAAPIDLPDEALTAGDPRLYLVRATEGSTLTISAASDGAVDAVVTVLDGFDATVVDTIDDAGAGETESFVRVVGDDYVVLAVADGAGGGGTFDLTINAADPVEYSAAADSLTFTEICPGAGGPGSVVDDYSPTGGFPADDEGWSGKLTLPFPFVYYGLERTEAFIGSNGYVAFGSDAPTSAGPGFGDPSGNDMLYPFVTDLVVTETCVHHDSAGGRYIIQYTGNPYLETDIVRFQVILDGATQTVSFVYDTTHELSEADAFYPIAIQGPAPSVSTEFTGSAAAGDSVTFTPL